MSIIKELNHVALKTGDLKATMYFYVDVLGAKIIRDLKDANGESYLYYVQLAEGVIEIIRGQQGRDELGFLHVAFLTDDNQDLFEICDSLKKMGYEFTDGPRKAASGIGHLAFFKDASGVLFELIQRKEDIRIPGLENEQLKEFAYISICVADEVKEKCADFYLNTLGLQERNSLPGKTYYSYGSDTMEAVHASADKPLSHIAFRVKDCFETKKYLESRGISCPQPEKASDGSYVINYIGAAGELVKFIDAPSLDNCGK